ncbi:uncharacterized protein LOC127870755 [Dreissena polymorpha]|uniref:Uncharacterized protein n=1 Tax=Dreissena polymorpha TaxID=45954 RepID=A0A9D4RSA7_DREPO|nr:uncharacterized protein LOC127870755 [Dreissena polymorpha]KAH3877048.1 hypothetical protein DPMN_000903 [Dreissena polymorpha]
MADNYMMMNNNYLPAIQRYPSNNLPHVPGLQNVFSLQHQSGMPISAGQAFTSPAVGLSSITANMQSSNEHMTATTSFSEEQCSIRVPTILNQSLSCVNQTVNRVVSSMSNTPTLSSVTGFTFTTPTQSCLYSPSLTSTTHSQLYNPSMGGRTFAPTGCSGTWQHTVPQRMPWNTNQQGINVFTGINTDTVCSVSLSNNQAVTSCSVSDMYAVASCSGMSTKHKRRHANEIDDMAEYSPGLKIHLTEEKIARHMQGLRIHTHSPPLQDEYSIEAIHDNLVNSQQQSQQESSPSHGPVVQTGDAVPLSSDAVRLQTSLEIWENYQRLEQRLDTSDDEMTEADERKDNQPRLCVNLSSLPKAVETNPVIPKDILEKILNPCREVILWSPPGCAFKSVNNRSSTSVQCFSGEDSSIPMEAIEQTQSVVPGCEMMTDGMEMESFEDSLDL